MRQSGENELKPESHWHELRDGRGKLCGRFDPVDLRLEIRRNQATTVFDLREYMDGGQRVDREAPRC